jgi:hypothetical protein
MSEFKGNKDKWMCYRKTDQHKIEEIKTDKGESICAINFALENSEENAKVLVKSREMFELLNEMFDEWCEAGISEHQLSEYMRKSKQLIK